MSQSQPRLEAAGQLPAAIRKGNFLDEFGFDAECYVLGDVDKTAVMTQRGIAAAVGLSKPGGKDFERLVSGKAISKHLGAEALAKVMQPIEFKWIYPGAKGGAQTISQMRMVFLLKAVMQTPSSQDERI